MYLKRTMLALATTGLSIVLLGCATRPSPTPPDEVPIAVKLKETPPPDLLVCAERPVGLPARPDQPDDVIQKTVRAALERIMPAFGRNASQLDRLVNWHRPGACPPPDT